MLFNSIDFLIFFPVVLFVYFFIPKKARYIWLLITSYYFYMSWNPTYALLIAFSTVITYLSGIIIARVSSSSDENRKAFKKKAAVAGSFIINLAILVVFKYSGFLLENVYSFLNMLGFEVIERSFDLLLPVGISFYTFQALSYTMDVYREKITPEKNLLKYALFVSFFPQLVAGPIERSENLITQIRKIATIDLWELDRIRHGAMLMLYGFFQKLIIADRAAILVNTVYNSYADYGFVEIAFATVIFAFQIYCDFDGYTNIARGAAEIMGFDLMKNFRQPYLATSIKDFWKRWHISLTSWFTDYLYIPLGGSRRGIKRTYVNVAIVFLVSGLWHGASWNYILWGVIHATFQIIEMLTTKHSKNKLKKSNCVVRLGKTLMTFLIVDFAWLFFRANSASESFLIIKQMTTVWKNDSIFNLGLDANNIIILAVGIFLLMLFDILMENKISVYGILCRRNICIRYALYLFAVWAVILLGVYGTAYDASQFIYFQF